MSNVQKFLSGYEGLFDQPIDEGGGGSSGSSANDTGFNSLYGWFYSTKQVAEFNGISMDEAYKLPVVQAMNDLSYLKAYNAHMKAKYKL